MSDQVTSQGQQYPDWQSAALGGNLLSYAWENRPSLGQLVPGYSADEPSYQKVLDYLSVPARVAAGPILQGGEAFQRWMAGEQGPDVREQITQSMLGIGGMGLGVETPGPASFGAWHGSRHLFEGTPTDPLGAFKDEAIGTGEGAQAYGHGHYVAGAKGVAESYKDAGDDLPGQGTWRLDGIRTVPVSFWDAADDTKPGSAERMQTYWGMHFLADHNGDHDAAIKDLHNQARDLYKQATSTKDPTDPHGTELDRQGLLQNALEYSQAGRWLSENKDRLSYEPPSQGHLYRVSVRPDEHELLDWDKPILQQSPEVQSKLSKIGMPYQELDHAKWTGEDTYKLMSRDLLGGDEGASQALHEAGIPGIKYLDQNSRDIQTTPRPVVGQSEPMWAVRSGHQDVDYHPTREEAEAHAESLRTRNYVIFHPSNLKVTDRDGVVHGLTPVDHDPWAGQ